MPRFARPPAVLALALGLLVFAACDGDGSGDADEGGDTTTGGELDEAAIVSEALGYPSFERINADPYPSAHGAAASINVFVPSEYAAAYRALDPDDPDATASFPDGTLVVKEHLDGEGEPAGVTIMYKAAGFDPDRNDWWWANASLDGTINDGGMVDYCIACHEPRADADWLFGVPADQQSAP